ncbi:MAG: 50S ribosomal protein L18 [Dehalococcoidia bacterium DG_22]|nr:MAG: 50S ribosomal protein L18 [Dehalococcoidia bacterium DG_22]
MKGKKTARAARVRRHRRVRQKVVGTPQRPRLCVFRSLNHIYAQVIDDEGGHTLIAACDLEADIRQQGNGKRKTEVASLVGQRLAERALEKGIGTAVFDRGGYKFHGRVKALADAARQGGLVF